MPRLPRRAPSLIPSRRWSSSSMPHRAATTSMRRGWRWAWSTTAFSSSTRASASTRRCNTPGMRALRPDGDAESLAGAFADVVALAAACRIRDCRHEQEPGCAVRAGVSPDHLRNYQKLLREIPAGHDDGAGPPAAGRHVEGTRSRCGRANEGQAWLGLTGRTVLHPGASGDAIRTANGWRDAEEDSYTDTGTTQRRLVLPATGALLARPLAAFARCSLARTGGSGRSRSCALVVRLVLAWRAHDNEIGTIALREPALGDHCVARRLFEHVSMVGVGPVTENPIHVQRVGRADARHR